MFAHTIFFEPSVQRSLESVVAAQGLYIHYNTYYLCPITALNGVAGDLPAYAQLSMPFKSINSIHSVFMYNFYESDPTARKLHFVSHNIRKY